MAEKKEQHDSNYPLLNHEIWKGYGIGEAGMEHVDRLAKVIMDFYKESGFEFSGTIGRAAMLEVAFQKLELPTRSEAYQQKAKLKYKK